MGAFLWESLKTSYENVMLCTLQQRFILGGDKLPSSPTSHSKAFTTSSRAGAAFRPFHPGSIPSDPDLAVAPKDISSVEGNTLLKKPIYLWISVYDPWRKTCSYYSTTTRRNIYSKVNFVSKLLSKGYLSKLMKREKEKTELHWEIEIKASCLVMSITKIKKSVQLTALYKTAKSFLSLFPWRWSSYPEVILNHSTGLITVPRDVVKKRLLAFAPGLAMSSLQPAHWLFLFCPLLSYHFKTAASPLQKHGGDHISGWSLHILP